MPTRTVTEPVADSKTKLVPLYRVLIHNDDVTPMDFVIKVLQEVFHLGLVRSTKVMWEAHTRGVAHVVTEPLERAEFHVDQTRSLARARHFPLTFSIEPE
jgi:ATP-dependent Clp protease adaptor protein ClpS